MVRSLLTVLALAVGLIWTTPAAAQTPGLLGREIVASVAGPGPDETRTLWIALPPDYDAPDQRLYDVVYVLDGRGLFPTAVAAARFLTAYEGAAPVIVVGVDSLSPALRRRDFTPTLGAAAPGEAGQADAFADFLARTVLPHVDGAYRTGQHRLLVGHSLSGLFALHVRAARPDLFSDHAAISPTLGWDGAEIVDRLGAGAAAPTGSAFVSMADDAPPYQAAMDGLEQAVGGRPGWTLARFPDESHVTTVPPALFDAMRSWAASSAP